MLYFAYGSNMFSKRLLQRITSAQKKGVAILPRHQLRFHKHSLKDGSAKCDIVETYAVEHMVYGVLYDIQETDKSLLDQFEGLGRGYEIKHVEVELKGSLYIAFTYFATLLDDTLKPFDWYKQHVISGARENGLPEDYVAMIESVGAIDDPDQQRSQQEQIIHRHSDK